MYEFMNVLPMKRERDCATILSFAKDQRKQSTFVLNCDCWCVRPIVLTHCQDVSNYNLFKQLIDTLKCNNKRNTADFKCYTNVI